jgi:hypothetical protein
LNPQLALMASCGVGECNVKQRSSIQRALSVALIALVGIFAGLASLPAVAEDIEKKFRIGFAAGVFNPQDQVTSDAGNGLRLVDSDLLTTDFYIDPRNDSAIFGVLDIQPTIGGTFYAQYAPTATLILEASIGYSKADFGDVEVQAQFDGVQVPQYQPFDFSVFRIPVGEIERVPVTLSALVRFRPRASLNPYLGGGIGYAVQGFSADDEFNDLSRNMDDSRGGFATLTPAFTSNPQLVSPPTNSFVDLVGASVEVNDTFEMHLAGGFEISFTPKWALILDTRWTFSSRKARVGFNNSDDLGVAVPQRTDFDDSDAATTEYGAYRITEGGLVDGGAWVSTDPTIDCTISTVGCMFDRTLRDGVEDSGLYYVQGGEVDYGALTFQVGVRYTF